MNSSRLSGLFFLALFSIYGYLSQDIHLDFWAAEDLFTARTFPELIALGGCLVSLAFIVVPAGPPAPQTEDIRTLNWKPALILLACLSVYGLILVPAGFLLATIILLGIAALILGERRWWLIALVSLTVPLVFMGLMNLLGIYLEPGILGRIND